MESREKICRFCLAKYDTDFKVIERKTHETLNILLATKNLAISDESVMCKNCEEGLIKCFNFKDVAIYTYCPGNSRRTCAMTFKHIDIPHPNFKATCLHTHNYIVQCVNGDHVKMNLKDVYVNRNGIASGVPMDQNVCAFCMGLVKNCSAVSLDVEEGNVTLEEMIKQCLPELDLNIIKTPVICISCRGFLQDCFHFAAICLDVSEKIKNGCKTPDVNSKDQVELTSSSLGFTIGDIAREVDDNLADIIKVEEEFCEDRKSSFDIKVDNKRDKFKLEQLFLDNREGDIKVFKRNFVKMNGHEVNNEQQFIPKNVLDDTGESNKLGSIKVEEIFFGENESKPKEENLVEVEDQTFLVNDEIEIKTDEHDFSRYEDGIVLSQSKVTGKLQRKGKYSTLDESNPYINTSTKKRVSQKEMYRSQPLSFKTNHEKSLVNHNSVNERFNKRSLVHKDPSEETMYKCDSCSYQTIRKHNLKSHLLKHMDPSEITMYKCHHCSFQAKRKYSLRTHLLKHKNPSEVTMYKCDSCSFHTNRKGNLGNHLLIHKDSSEITMLKCHSCLYQTKRKQDLKNHLIIHKNPSEVAMYKCHYCSFQTKYKRCLEGHLLRHNQNPSEITLYKCTSCSFQTKCKDYFKKHVMAHTNPSDVTMYKCDSCSFHTEHKNSLKNHLLTHKNPLEITMFKCHSCLYQTRHKRNLKRHFESHKGTIGGNNAQM